MECGGKVHIIIGADIVPTPKSQRFFDEGDVHALVGNDLMEVLQRADIRLFNLEVPLSDAEQPIVKCGPNLITPISGIRGIKALNPTYVTLANNHIMDHGTEGLNSTIRILDENGIQYGGVGSNLSQASEPWLVEKNGIRVGVYCCAEHEFSIVTNDAPGANPFDALNSFDHVSSLKQKCDYVIVLYHGGKEHYRYPSPELQKVCRKFVDVGANLVVCQHSHCIGCEEKYGQGTIVYGQGNFLFDKHDNEFWNSGLLVSLSVDHHGDEVSYVPLVRNSPGVRMATNDQNAEIMNAFHKRTEEIKEDGFVQKQYLQFAESRMDGYLLGFAGNYRTLFTRILNKLMNNSYAQKMIRQRYTKQFLLNLLNFMECEAHRELIIQGLKSYINKSDNG